MGHLLTPDRSALKWTRIGLLTIYYGIVAVVAVATLGILIVLLGPFLEFAPAMMLGPVLFLICGLGGGVAIIIGHSMCLTVPRESGGRRDAQISLAMLVTAFLLAMFEELFLTASASIDAGVMTLVAASMLYSLLMNAILFASYAYFLLYLKNVALSIQRPDLSSKASNLLRRVIGTAVLISLTQSISLVMPITGAVFPALVALGILCIAIFITGLFTLVMYSNFIRTMAHAIMVGNAAPPRPVSG